MDCDDDEEFRLAVALSISESGFTENIVNCLKEDTVQKEDVSSLIDPSLELIDPNPDIHSLFLVFNKQYFYNKLNSVEIRWSPRMTLCAGVCSYQTRSGYCSIRLSVPLLKLRPRKDMIETMLHEMIHAYLFVTRNNRDRDDHGPNFLEHMFRINKAAGTNITVYHSFHDEVNVYKTHWWKCNGVCRSKPPFYGMVKRSMNRAPGPNDTWWAQHQAMCGGEFIKIREPENYGKKKKDVNNSSSENKNDISRYFNKPNNHNIELKKPAEKTDASSWNKKFSSDKNSNSADKTFPKIGNKRPNVEKLVPSSKSQSTSSVVGKGGKRNCNKFGQDKQEPINKGLPSSSSADAESSTMKFGSQHVLLSSVSNRVQFLDSLAPVSVQCPICSVSLLEKDMSLHLDTCAVLGNCFGDEDESLQLLPHSSAHLPKTSHDAPSDDHVLCPSCQKNMPLSEINFHLDRCLSNSS